MKLKFCGNIEELKDGIAVLSDRLGIFESKAGLKLRVEKVTENKIEVIKNSEEAVIRYRDKVHFFRALGLFMEKSMEQNAFQVVEYPQFRTDGVMFDISQNNAVASVKTLKDILQIMSIMGLNVLMLYSEDSYCIEGEPYFGYMRSRYSNNELKEIDDYAFDLGVEVIPCIQTLAHLIDVLKWERYWDIRDDDDTLLVGNEKTYEFIEKIIASASAPFRSKRIHIGMDEAFKLGQGEYLLQNGLKPKFDIMNEHLEKVMKIVQKYGLDPMIWSDMYFRAISKTGDYYDQDVVIPKELAANIPQNVQLVYWDYEHQDKNTYSVLINKHKELGSTPIFAGGIWCWNGYTVDYDKTFITTNPALMACKEAGVEEVIATIWGDGGCESNIYSNLLGMQLYAEHGYARELDLEKLKKRFLFCTGCNYDDFYRITYLDKLPGMATKEGWNFTNPSRYLMWQDVLMGLFDKNIEGLGLSDHYAQLTEKLHNSANLNGKYGTLFEFLAKVSSVLSLKSEMGLRITSAYRTGKKSELNTLAKEELPRLKQKIEQLKAYHYRLWMDTYKPIGWEVLDIRYGGLLARVDAASVRIIEYLEGRTDRIEELEQEKLYFYGEPGLVPCNLYSRIVSASRLSYSTAY